MTTLKDSAERAGSIASEKLHVAGDKVRDTAEAAKTAASEAIEKARDKTGAAIEQVKDKATSAYGTARERATSATRRTSDGIDANPVAAIAAGLAIGAAIAALLPRTERETKLLGPVGARVNGLAKTAAEAAKDAGKLKLAELGLDGESMRQQVSKLLDGAIEAAGTAGGAAAESVRARKG